MNATTETPPVSIPTTDDLRQQARVVKDDLRGLTKTAKEVAQDKLGEVKQKAAGYVDEGKQKVVRAEDQVESYIREQPLKSVLIAAGAGVLLGFLLSRR